MARVLFRLNTFGMEAFIASIPAPMDDAEKIADEARRIAPYAETEQGDHYRDSIETGEFFDSVSKRNTAYVLAAVPWALKVELIHTTLRSAMVGEYASDGP